MKISNKTREQAAMLCQIAASNYRSIPPGVAVRSIGASGRAFDLAYDAWDASVAAAKARGETVESGDVTCAAEAEAMLRTGWEP